MTSNDNDLMVTSISSVINTSTRELLSELPGLSEDITNERVISIIKAASKTGLVAGWIIGKLLLEVKNAISNNAEGFEYNSMDQWFDDYEDELPFKRSAAKVYTNIAENISFEQFTQLGYRKSNLLLGVKNETGRTALISKAITEGLSSDQIREEINDFHITQLPQVDESVEISKPVPVTKNGNMYELSVQQWNPFKGCNFDCLYCKESFQKQEKRDLRDCKLCRDYKPHEHAEQLLPEYELKSTPYMKFIFTCASGDISFCSDEYLQCIIDRIRIEENKNFLLQSKNPATFNRMKLPKNLIIGTTIETNRDKGYSAVSKAPKPSKRYKDFTKLNHPYKMLTLEPMMKFDLDVMLEWVDNINPVFIWLGTDSVKSVIHKNDLEPSMDEIMALYYNLGVKGYTVMLKEKLIKRISAEI